MSRAISAESRKVKCCGQEIPGISSNSYFPASSNIQGGGVTYVRIRLAPSSAIREKSLATRSDSGYDSPREFGAKGPYETPRAKNLCQSWSMYLPRTDKRPISKS